MSWDTIETLLAGVGISVLGVALYWWLYIIVTDAVDYVRYRRGFAAMRRQDRKDGHR